MDDEVVKSERNEKRNKKTIKGEEWLKNRLNIVRGRCMYQGYRVEKGDYPITS